MYEYRNVIHRLRQGQTLRAIAKETFFGRNKVKRIKLAAEKQGWLDLQITLPDESILCEIFEIKSPISASGSKVEPYAEQIQRWVKEGVQASTIHQHLMRQHGFKGAYNSVQRFVKKIKNAIPPELTVPLHFKPGEAAQVDFGKGPKLYDERVDKEIDTWFFVMTLCWSRHQYVELITHQDIETWLSCHQRAFNWFGGVPSKIIIDNPKCAITKACYYDPHTQRSYEELAQAYGFIISACPPRDPQKKGRVESGVKYVKRNFLPLRNFKSLQHANKELKDWVLGTAGNRKHGNTFEKPLSRFTEIETHQLKTLPITQPEIAVWKKVKLYRDCHVRFEKARYSAPHQLYGEDLWLKITSSTVSIYFEYKREAVHSRLFKPGAYNTKQEHLPANAQTYFKQDANWCLTKSQDIGAACQFVIEAVLTDPTRDLLRQAQGILGLRKGYGAKRLELACRRARIFNAINYKTIKAILKEGLDYEVLEKTEAFTQLGSVYQGEARYQRNLSDLTH